MIKEKIIWMCWFQGEDSPSMPALNKKCIKKWKELNPDWQVNILSNKKIRAYVPEYFDICSNSPKRGAAHRADLLRLLLLSRFGGVWVDCSVYPMLPLSEFYNKIVNGTGFFSYRFIPRSLQDLGDRETVVWFLCSDWPNHSLIDSWKNDFIEVFEGSGRLPYFAMAQNLCKLYDRDNDIQSIVNNMVQISERIPHSALCNWEQRKDSYMYKRPELPQ